MRQNHFNASLSKATSVTCNAVLKWKLRFRIKFTMSNGGKQWHAQGEAIIIRRTDVEKVHDYARAHADLRDFLIIRMPIKIGLRTTELTTLERDDINFKTRSFRVLDAKRKRYCLLPLDVMTLQLMENLMDTQAGKFIFHRKTWTVHRQNKPLTRNAVWSITSQIGLEAGVEGYNPRMGRHYFACKWVEDMKKPGSSKTEADLRAILRHKNPLSLTFYLAKLRFFEDLQKAYHEMQEPYIDTQELSDFYREHCQKCEREPTCKFVDQVSASPWASGCRFYTPKKEVII